ncbi:pyridoxine biosynthesis protein [Scheffersomyces spartinae]|uniref:Dihydrolipoamide dehydrogenase-binding protein of pyruvate dehydrogenase complex n=1 Tax=Scheffersomyces spartinae TaxID=45513 RepID=A0A9P7V8Q0_9ASCO|nr:pyridoxine biosynthesis protein [Scheffersomyces spartinae]KAG7193249.1 pyridoxine biosynthesis protein [Scheffersomyces spartinae]
MLRTVTRPSLALFKRRFFHNSAVTAAASVFKMPAMSPTMEEGGIVGWKVKAGQEFAAGDVILEVETDKANIDVEAQDDGILWEIIEQDGAHGIPVGKPIALLAEPGDDLASLEKPSFEDSAAKPTPATSEAEAAPPAESSSKSATESPKQEETNTTKSKGSSEVFSSANPNQKLLPSVELLLHENGINAEDALSKIPASGPKGRILKGDVLAYLGKIANESIEQVTAFIKEREHLDLNNIVLAEPKKKTEGEPSKPKKANKSEKPPAPKNIVKFELTVALDSEVSPNTFQHAFNRTLSATVHDTYAAKFPQYQNSPSAVGTLTANEIFDELLAPSVSKSRFNVSVPKFTFHESKTAPSSTSSPSRTRSDSLFDELVGFTPSPSPLSQMVATTVVPSVDVTFELTLNLGVNDARTFASHFELLLLNKVPASRVKVST